MTPLIDRMHVTVPEGEDDGMTISRFTVTGEGLADLKHALEGRPCLPGEYTMLREGETIWMSDTTAERRDHLTAVAMIRALQAHRVLINGLGLGMVVAAALTFDHVDHIDVVEADERVLRLVGPHYAADPRVHLHHADAYQQAKRWPRGSGWHVIWHDVWPTISEDNLPAMARLHRSYGQRCLWQGSWAKDQCQAMRREQRAWLADLGLVS